jgi:predicted transcriptional regulator YdeE
MNYEIVQIKEKTVVGLRTRTSNSDPNMAGLIGELWQRFFSNGIYQSISDKQNDKSIGLYTNYESDVNGLYDVMVCCEVQNTAKLPAGVEVQTIPEGKYAKFVVHGDMQKAVAEFWMKLWSIDLDRKFSCDFEEYQSGCDMNNEEIHIYIALN